MVNSRLRCRQNCTPVRGRCYRQVNELPQGLDELPIRRTNGVSISEGQWEGTCWPATDARIDGTRRLSVLPKNNIGEVSSGREAVKLLTQQSTGSRLHRSGSAANVRRYQEIGSTPQWVVREQRFRIGHI
jgi:hypothetical protein